MITSFWDTYGLSIVAISIMGFVLLVWFVGRRYKSTSNILPVFSKSLTRESSVSSGELECKKTLEEHFNKKFDKIRPDFLRNPVTSGKSQYNLELDCYNPELKLAVEYNGKQHYSYIPFFHRNKEAFLNQKYRDELKRMLCKENGVILIEVPYTIPVSKIKPFILGMLKSMKITNNIFIV